MQEVNSSPCLPPCEVALGRLDSAGTTLQSQSIGAHSNPFISPKPITGAALALLGKRLLCLAVLLSSIRSVVRRMQNVHYRVSLGPKRAAQPDDAELCAYSPPFAYPFRSLVVRLLDVLLIVRDEEPDGVGDSGLVLCTKAHVNDGADMKSKLQERGRPHSHITPKQLRDSSPKGRFNPRTTPVQHPYKSNSIGA